MWTWIVLACTRAPEPEPPAPPPPAGDTGSETDTDTGTPPPVVPLLDEALAGRCDPAADLEQLPLAGTDLLAVTLDEATARCNDGTPPVLYVRPATDPAHASDWVLYLDSGGSCDSDEECVARWCADDNYDATKMSTRWAPEGIAGGGILAPAPHNAFAGWNAVHFYYCSSDLWLGQATDVVLDAGTPYRLHFDGHGIAAEGFAALEAGATSDDGSLQMPSLADADTVVLVGASAGAVGAALHFDDLQARLPSATVLGVVDSMLTPVPEAFPDPKLRATYDAAWTAEMQNRSVLWDVFTDPDCMAALGDAALCIELGVLWTGGYTSTPVLLHYDLYDAAGNPIDDHIPVSPQEQAAMVVTSLQAYADVGVSVHGTACGKHMAVNGPYFTEMTVDGVSTHDATVSLVAGQTVEVIDDVARSGSSCP